MGPPVEPRALHLGAAEREHGARTLAALGWSPSSLFLEGLPPSGGSKLLLWCFLGLLGAMTWKQDVYLGSRGENHFLGLKNQAC